MVFPTTPRSLEPHSESAGRYFAAGSKTLGNPRRATLVEVAGSNTLGKPRVATLVEVTFHRKKEIDPDRAPQFNLVAEEVERRIPI